MAPTLSTTDTRPAISAQSNSALRVTALVCVVAGVVLVGVAMTLVAATENTCHKLYGKSISQIPMGEWPPSTWIYCGVWMLGAAVALTGVTCAVICVVRARKHGR
jgi:demethoxyubiquinone hydroxylase (CLK1/Coq7/Cat5 family)